MKRKFLAVSDYGKGGNWCFIAAHDVSEIASRYPELRVFESPPDWMSSEDVDRIARLWSYDIDEDPRGLLAVVIKERGSA